MRWALALVLAGCAARQPVIAAPVVAVAKSVDDGLEPLLEQRCGSCHDGSEPGRPVFDAHRLSSREAMQVALAVASGLMPPPPAALPDDVRLQMIALPCQRAGRPSDEGKACIARLSRPAPEVWLVGMDAMMRIAERAAERTEPGVPFDPASRKKLEATFVLADPDTRTMRLDGSLATLLALHAAERCGDPAQVGESTYRACVIAITDYRSMALPAPRVSK